MFDWLWFMNNYAACNPFKYNPESANIIFEKLIGDLNLVPFGDTKNELAYQEVLYLSNIYWYTKLFGPREYITNPHVKGICQTLEVVL